MQGAVNQNVAASTQNQAFNAINYPYKIVLNKSGRGVRSPLDVMGSGELRYAEGAGYGCNFRTNE